MKHAHHSSLITIRHVTLNQKILIYKLLLQHSLPCLSRCFHNQHFLETLSRAALSTVTQMQVVCSGDQLGQSYVSFSVMPKANQLILSTTRLKSLLDKFYFPVVPWPLYRLIQFQNSPLERRFACCQSATVHSFLCEPSLSGPFK